MFVRSMHVASCRIVDNWVSRQIAEVTGGHGRCWKRACIGSRKLPLRCAFVIDEKEHLVFHNRATERAAPLVLIISVLLREQNGIGLEIIACREALVGMEYDTAAVELVSAILGNHFDLRAGVGLRKTHRRKLAGKGDPGGGGGGGAEKISAFDHDRPQEG